MQFSSSKIILFALISSVLSTSVTVLSANAETESPLSGLYACTTIEDNDTRLACYDQAAGRIQKDEEKGDLTAISREQADEVRRESFGFSLPSIPRIFDRETNSQSSKEDKAKPKKINEIELAVKSIRKDPYGKVIVTMENGQVWRQTTTDVTFRKKKADIAEIRKGSLGSYFMKLDGSKAMRAKRTK